MEGQLFLAAIAVIVVLLVLRLLFKLWRLFLGLGVAAGLVFGLCTSEIVDCDPPGGGHSSSTGHESSDDLSVIYSVCQHVEGKTFEEYLDVPTDDKRLCSASECDYDLRVGSSFCRGGGGLCGYKTTRGFKKQRVVHQCPSPPAATSPEWHVQSQGPDSWTVSNTQGRWRVERFGSEYRVTPYEKC